MKQKELIETLSSLESFKFKNVYTADQIEKDRLTILNLINTLKDYEKKQQ